VLKVDSELVWTTLEDGQPVAHPYIDLIELETADTAILQQLLDQFKVSHNYFIFLSVGCF
jgi:hypothetical protein